ncbi:hypothetical protein J3R82DRAFT_9248 [Butyriboletus roseoflavus]|nr:hypothetical protein J3R82DRAFT_9248 [Butyriboletus roseoflavus]
MESRTQLELESAVRLKRNQLLDALGRHVFNDLPAHLIQISDMKLLSRTDLWEDLRAYIRGLSSADLLALRSPKEDAQARVKYAIFSHRWGAHEPSYQQLSRNQRWMDDATPTNSPGLLKLLRFCDKVRVYGCPYAWSDTCCIDKSSSAELEEAIRAMYRWYRDAEVCIVHLAATDNLADFEHEPWFTRGWTLQELLAPKRITFYNKEWASIFGNAVCPAESRNDKEDWRVLGTITKVTGIPAGDLRHFRPGCERVSEKMRWASQRGTTRAEDVAYALLGIFDITIPISYGEGQWAFHRLMEGIAQRSSEPGFFAWAGDASPYSLAYPCSPASYGMPVLDAQTVTGLRLTGSVFEEVGDQSYSITKLGLQVKLLLLPVRWIQQAQGLGSYTLSFAEGIFLETSPSPTLSQAYYEIFKPEQCVLGVVNYTRVTGDRGTLRVGERYFGFLLMPSGRSGYVKARTDQVLVWRCMEGVTKDLENVCLLNTLSPYGRDITT